ncbi:MAG TPA: hypothetical protein V6D05_18995 [Stenomitos sp.]
MSKKITKLCDEAVQTVDAQSHLNLPFPEPKWPLRMLKPSKHRTQRDFGGRRARASSFFQAPHGRNSERD